jgi:hypothetical protein
MQAHSNKVQPLTLDNLLIMRRHLAQRLNVMLADGVKQTGPLEDLFERCDTAIHQAQVDERISALRAGPK